MGMGGMGMGGMGMGGMGMGGMGGGMWNMPREILPRVPRAGSRPSRSRTI